MPHRTEPRFGEAAEDQPPALNVRVTHRTPPVRRRPGWRAHQAVDFHGPQHLFGANVRKRGNLQALGAQHRGHALGHPVGLAGRKIGQGQPQQGQEFHETLFVPAAERLLELGEHLGHEPQRAAGRLEQAAQEVRPVFAALPRAVQMAVEMRDKIGFGQRAVCEEQPCTAAPQGCASAGGGRQGPQGVGAKLLQFGTVAQRADGLKEPVEGVEHLGFVFRRRDGQRGNHVAGAVVGGRGQFVQAGQMMGLQRLARDFQHQQVLHGRDQRVQRRVRGDQSGDAGQQVLGMPMQPHAAGVQHELCGRGGAAAPALAFGFGKAFQQQAVGRLFDRGAVERPLDQGRLGLRRPVIGPDFLDPLEVRAGDEVRPANEGGERHLDERQPMQQPADFAMGRTAVQIEHGFGLVEHVELELEPQGRVAEIVYDRRLARLGGHVAYAVAGQPLAGQGQDGHAFGVVGPLDEDAADAVEHVFARGLLVSAKPGQPLDVRHGGDGVRRGGAQVPPAAIAGDLDQQVRRVLFLPSPLVEVGRRHAAGIAVEPIELLEAVAHQHELIVFRGELHRFGQGRGGLRQGHGVETAGDHDRSPLLLGDGGGHGLLACQAAVGLEGFLRRVPPRQGAIGQHAAHELGRVDTAVVNFVKMVPQVVGVAGTGPHAGRPQQPAVREPALVLHALRAPTTMSTSCPGCALGPIELVGLDLLGKRQVDEADLRPSSKPARMATSSGEKSQTG